MNFTLDIEWLRIITIVLAFTSLIKLAVIYRRTKLPVIIAPMTWLILVFGYALFKFIVDGSSRYYSITLIINNIILLFGIILILIAAFLFEDIKKWIRL